MDKAVRTRFVRGYPVRHWFKRSGKRNVALNRRVYGPAALHARRVRGRSPRRANRTTVATITARGRWPAKLSLVIAAVRTSKPLGTPQHTILK
jgi:phage terminase large subunit GpA-like protein